MRNRVFPGNILLSVAVFLVLAMPVSSTACYQTSTEGSLTSVIVGGLIAIIGSGVTGCILFKLHSGQEIGVFKRSKLEEMALLAYECNDWLDHLKLKYLVQGDLTSIVEKFPVSRMRMIQALYFPSLQDQVLHLSSAVEDFRSIIILERPRLKETHTYSEEFKTQYEAKQEAVLTAITDLVREIEAIMPNKFQCK